MIPNEKSYAPLRSATDLFFPHLASAATAFSAPPLFLYSSSIDPSFVDQLCVNNVYRVLWEAGKTWTKGAVLVGELAALTYLPAKCCLFWIFFSAILCLRVNIAKGHMPFHMHINKHMQTHACTQMHNGSESIFCCRLCPLNHRDIVHSPLYWLIYPITAQLWLRAPQR